MEADIFFPLRFLELEQIFQEKVFPSNALLCKLHNGKRFWREMGHPLLLKSAPYKITG